MTGGARAQGAGRERVRRGLVAVAAVAWCLLLTGVLLGIQPEPARGAGMVVGWAGQAQAQGTAAAPLAATTTVVVTPTPPTPTKVASPTATATAAATEAPTATAQPTVAQPTTDTSGSSNGAGGAVGPQPTRQNLAQPTIGATQGGATGSFSPSDLTSPWLLVFSTLGCVLGLAGLGTALVTWYLLVSEGWGPLLKAVLLGNRKGTRTFSRRPPGPAQGARQPARMPAAAARPRSNWR